MPVIIGTSNPETLDGTSAADSIFGLGGDDTLNGLGDNDFLDGGTGDDILNGGDGDDVYVVDSLGDSVNEDVGRGFDIVYAMASYILAGAASVERLSAIDHLSTDAMDLTGNDIVTDVYGDNGANVLTGGAADNIILGFGGTDTLNGLGGRDSLFGMDGTDTLNGGADKDFLDGGAGDDALNGGAGDDVYVVDSAGDAVTETAGEGFDIVYATTTYVLAAAAGVERLSSVDHLSTTAQDLTGNGLVAEILGNNGANVLTGGSGDNAILGFGGDDTLRGLGGNDILYGGIGIDDMIGGTGDDIYFVDNILDRPFENENTNEGNDAIYTSVDYRIYLGFVETLAASDRMAATGTRLFGDVHQNFIHGDAGDNLLSTGYGGDDVLTGYAGADVFNFTLFMIALGATHPSGMITIADFAPGVDKIRLDTMKFAGVLGNAGFFEVGAAPTAASTRIMYDPATGNLRYDQDGNAPAGSDFGAVFAHLTPGLTLTAADFIVEANRAPEATPDFYSIEFSGVDKGVALHIQQNDLDLDGLNAWVTQIGASGQPLQNVGTGPGPQTFAGIYGNIVGGGKSNSFSYIVLAGDPDTMAIAPGQTVTETFDYVVSDGVTSDPTVHVSGGLTAQSTITITITRSAASGALASSVAAAAPADAQEAAPASDPVPASAFADGYPGEAVWQVRSGDALVGLVLDLWVG